MRIGYGSKQKISSEEIYDWIFCPNCLSCWYTTVTHWTLYDSLVLVTSLGKFRGLLSSITFDSLHIKLNPGYLYDRNISAFVFCNDDACVVVKKHFLTEDILFTDNDFCISETVAEGIPTTGMLGLMVGIIVVVWRNHGPETGPNTCIFLVSGQAIVNKCFDF